MSPNEYERFNANPLYNEEPFFFFFFKIAIARVGKVFQYIFLLLCFFFVAYLSPVLFISYFFSSTPILIIMTFFGKVSSVNCLVKSH